MSDTKQWPGTPAEWDAELTARMNRLVEANFTAGSRSVRYVATATMPPRPVERPSVVTARGWSVEWDGTFFSFRQITTKNRAVHDRRAHVVAACVGATDDEYAKIAALRDGPAPRYEVCGWRCANGLNSRTWQHEVFPQTDCEEAAKSYAQSVGGTAHAIYRRVEGDK